MEYAWGLAASRTPMPPPPPSSEQRRLSSTSSITPLVRPSSPPSTAPAAGAAANSSSSKSTSTSTSESKTSKQGHGYKRPRIPGHSRPPSSSRKQIDSSSHEISQSLQQQEQQQQLRDTAVTAASATATATATAGSLPRDDNNRKPASSTTTTTYQDKQLASLPRQPAPDNSNYTTTTTTTTAATINNTTTLPGLSLGGTSTLSTAAYFKQPQRDRDHQPPSSTSHFASAKPTSAGSLRRSTSQKRQNTLKSTSAANAPDRKRPPLSHHHAAMPGSDTAAALNNKIIPASRTNTATTSTLYSRAMNSSDAVSSVGDVSSAASQTRPQRPFVVKSNGRAYLNDPASPYPLPVDLQELHRQSLRTLLLFQCFGGPVCSPAFANKPPTKVLELGCGFGFWSMMCHRYYSRQGHAKISFTGLDIAAVGGISSQPSKDTSAGNDKDKTTEPSPAAPSDEPGHLPDKNMKWRFVQHDIRKMPWPFEDEEFDLIMAKDLSLVIPNSLWQLAVDEHMRLLKPGGTLEIWEGDHTIRMLRPHTPEASKLQDGNGDEEKRSDESQAAELGAYIITANTPLSSPMNTFLVEYNSWFAKYADQQQLNPVPCTMIGSILIQEPCLSNGGSKRLAIPLSEVRWEREGVGGVITKDGKSYIDSKGSKDGDKKKGKALTPGQKAMRKTALLTVVQFIQGLEPVLREASGKQQDEWDAWMGRMMADLMNNTGTSSGECLEVGAWWAQKKKKS